MLDVSEATAIARKTIPNGRVELVVPYKGLFLFQIFLDDPLEGNLDPFYAVNRETGEFRDYSILTDGVTSEIAALFMAAKKAKEGIA